MRHVRIGQNRRGGFPDWFFVLFMGERPLHALNTYRPRRSVEP
jgi:hypothetical protein